MSEDQELPVEPPPVAVEPFPDGEPDLGAEIDEDAPPEQALPDDPYTSKSRVDVVTPDP